MQKRQAEFEQFRIAIEDYLKTTVEELLSQPIPHLSMEKFTLFEKTGNRLLYEKDYFARRKYLTVFGVAALILTQEKDETIGDCKATKIYRKLEETLLSICEEECWALPAHVDRVNNPEWRNTIDLFAAETAQTLMDIVDMAGDKLSTDGCLQVKEQVHKRVLQPFFESTPGTYGWEICDNNWNAVCNGCIGSAYLHSLSKDEVPHESYLQRICNNLLHYIDGFAEDGTCPEGLGYYFYGMTYFMNFAQELFTVTQGRMDLLHGSWGMLCDSKQPILAEDEKRDKRIRVAKWWTKCYFDNGFTVSFSDGSSREKYRIGLAYILAQEFGSLQLPPIKQAAALEEDACYRYLPFKQDMLAICKFRGLLQENKKGVEDLALNAVKTKQTNIAHILPVAQWCIAQVGKTVEEDGDASIIGFACKGGHNGEAHNHNDVGSFLYVAGEDMFLVDLGAGEYTKEYFGSGRYDILCNRSTGHNVPMINGLEQLVGEEYRCKTFHAEEDAQCVKVTMDLERAYGIKMLKKFQRSIVFQKENGACEVTDLFKCNEEMFITENLVTRIEPQCKGTEVWLKGREKICRIKIEPAQKPEIITMEHSNHQGVKEQVYLIQWKMKVKTKAQIQMHISV